MRWRSDLRLALPPNIKAVIIAIGLMYVSVGVSDRLSSTWKYTFAATASLDKSYLLSFSMSAFAVLSSQRIWSVTWLAVSALCSVSKSGGVAQAAKMPANPITGATNRIATPPALVEKKFYRKESNLRK